ncbi:MAG: GAF domain-containing protein [Terriglobales bacterium]
MSNHEQLLQEFEASSHSHGGVRPLMQHIAQQLHDEMTRYNWVGFYLMERPHFDALVVGPYAGSFQPTPRITLDQGLCGAAASTGKTVVVNDVQADPRYLGSDLVKSNIVVPILLKNRVAAELCIESYFANTFDAAERKFIESCAELVGRCMENEPIAATGAGASH